MLEHLNLFSIDDRKRQHHQQQFNKIDINITADLYDKVFQSTIQDEKNNFYVENYIIRSPPSPTNNIDQPLIIVLDDDEDTVSDDENNKSDVTTIKPNHQDKLSTTNEEHNAATATGSLSQGKQSLNKTEISSNLISTSPSNCELDHHTKNSCLHPATRNDCNCQITNTIVQTVVIDTNFMRQTHQQQTRHRFIAARRKNSNKPPSPITMSNNMSSKNLSVSDSSLTLSSNDSILSTISFDDKTNILTVSRMGSIFYCLEDLYTKVFSMLCTLDEFINLLSKSEIILIKQVTLSEKITIDQKIPSLKKYNDNRYRLISINSSDYMIKLKQLLSSMMNQSEYEKQQREKYINQIIDEMRSFRRTPTPVLLKDKVLHSPMATKRLSSDDDDDDDEENDEEPRKRLKIVTKKPKLSNEAPAQFGIFIQCNGPVSCNIYSTNETVSSSTTTTTSTTETTTSTTTSSTVATSESEIISKSTSVKKQNETTHMYFDKVQQQCQTLSKFNLNNEQSTAKSPNLTRTNSHSPADATQINKSCSPSVMNMPKKWRILNSYNNDINDTSTTRPKVHIPIISSRCLYRSKSLTYNHQPIKNTLRRASSLSSLKSNRKEDVSIKKYLSIDNQTKSNTKSTAEPIDLTDENFSMPMIVNVEENVELANQRHKVKSKPTVLTNKLKASPPVAAHSDAEEHPSMLRPISHVPSSPSMLTKPTPIHHPMPAYSYRAPSYSVYHRESYAYRDASQTISSSLSTSHPYYQPTNNMNNGHPYPYSCPPSAQYPTMKKSKDIPTNNSFDVPLNSTTPNNHTPVNTASTTNGHHHHHPLPSQHHTSLPTAMSIVRKPNFYHHPQQLTLDQQQTPMKLQLSPPSSVPCRLSCCYQTQTPTLSSSSSSSSQLPTPVAAQHSADKLTPNERYMYRQYSVPPTAPPAPTIKRDPSQTPDLSSLSPSIHRKQRRLDPMPPTSTAPYPSYAPSKPYFVSPAPPTTSPYPPSHWPSSSPVNVNPNTKPTMRYPYPPAQNSPINNLPGSRSIESYPQPRRPTPVPSRMPSTTPIVAQNSSILISPPNTPHELTLPNIRTRSIDLQRAIAERGYCDMDKLPKLVVRHTKAYANKTVDTMGQLFPTWFNEPDYRCIHCFRCDQVFTPQQFMTHVDDELMQNEQPINMTSIQLLTSEKMSEYKVGLWNQFCTNLTIYAREGRIGGFSTNRNV